jgi:hypothetical protein
MRALRHGTSWSAWYFKGLLGIALCIPTFKISFFGHQGLTWQPVVNRKRKNRNRTSLSVGAVLLGLGLQMALQ